MSRFKVGDRVAVYDGRLIGGRGLGEVIDAGPDGPLIEVLFKDNGRHYVHPKQCRRLVKRAKPREWAVRHNGSGCLVIEEGDAMPSGDLFRVREVRSKP